MPVTRARRRGVRRGAWVLAVVAVALAAGVAVWPWNLPPGPDPTTDPSLAGSGPTPTVSEPTPTPTGTASATPPPTDPVLLDPSTLGLLFVGTAELRATVPGLGPDVTVRAEPTAWGLPEGASVDPSRCLPARTVLAAPPAAFAARTWRDGDVVYRQDLLLLADAATARAEFAALVQTLDGCPTYTQTDAGGAAQTWHVEPALEGQGAYPSVVAGATVTADGSTRAQNLGHMRVGNVIVSWSVTAGPGVPAPAEVLGTPDALDALVQQRATAAVLALA